MIRWLISNNRFTIFIFFILAIIIFFRTRNDDTETECPVLNEKVDEDTLKSAAYLLFFLSLEDKIHSLEFSQNTVLFVSCNWYDTTKLKRLAVLSKTFPNEKVVVTGGLGRLSSKRAKELGGEALELRENIIKQTNIPADRLALFTGLRTTTDNVDMLFAYLEKVLAKEGKTNFSIIAVEESYLVQRLRATIKGQLDRTARDMQIRINDLFVVSSDNQKSLLDVLQMHHSPIITLFFMVEEFERLMSYSNPNNIPFLFWEKILDYGEMDKLIVKSAVENIKRKHQKIFLELKQMMKDKDLKEKCLAKLQPKL